jgi:hypothetical protein
VHCQVAPALAYWTPTRPEIAPFAAARTLYPIVYGQRLAWKSSTYLGTNWSGFSWLNLPWNDAGWNNIVWDSYGFDELLLEEKKSRTNGSRTAIVQD